MTMPSAALRRDEVATLGDVLPRVVGLVLDHLLRRHVERDAHNPAPSSRPPSCAAARVATMSSGMASKPAADDRGDGREDAAHDVGAAGGGVLVGGGEQRPQCEVDRLVAADVLPPGGLDPVAGVDATRAVGLEVGFLVLAAGGVVAEDAAPGAVDVVTGEERHDHEALHRRGQVGPHELAELVGLALERQDLALDLLVVLELDLEELDQLDRRARGAGDGDAGERRRRRRPSRPAGWRSCTRRWHAGRRP